MLGRGTGALPLCLGRILMSRLSIGSPVVIEGILDKREVKSKAKPSRTGVLQCSGWSFIAQACVTIMRH